MSGADHASETTCSTPPARPFGRVLTVPSWYDGPRGGLAEYLGEPHFFESLFVDNADTEDAYLLWPAASDDVAVVLEEWAIWLRWANAERAPPGSHPALPEDRARYELIKVAAARAYQRRPAYACFANAEWAPDPTRPGSAATFGGLLVRWTIITSDVEIHRLRMLPGLRG